MNVVTARGITSLLTDKMAVRLQTALHGEPLANGGPCSTRLTLRPAYGARNSLYTDDVRPSRPQLEASDLHSDLLVSEQLKSMTLSNSLMSSFLKAPWLYIVMCMSDHRRGFDW
jgi:hypothetical protein